MTRSDAPLVRVDDAVASAYRSRFAQGATVVPRVLFLVGDQPAGPLGLAAGGRAVRSERSAGEKRPWKDLDPLQGVVEAGFVRPVHLGATVLPYRLLPPAECVVPWDGRRLLDGDDPRLDLYPGLAAWWREAERRWLAHRSSDRLTLREQLDYYGKFTDQFPIQPRRVVYSASGMHLVAARVTDPVGVVEHKLYWATASSDDEAWYLCAVLNSARTTELVRPLMSYGKDERDIDKYVWRLPIPLYDPGDDRHRCLAALGRRAEEEVAALDLDEGRYFVSLRRAVREHLAGSAIGREIDRVVEELLTTAG